MTPSTLLLSSTIMAGNAQRSLSVENLFDPSRSDALANRLYSVPDGGVYTLQAFATSGKTPQVSGQEYTISVSAADPAWIIANGVYEYNSGGGFIGLKTSGVVRSADSKTMSWTATADGTFGVNFQYTVNGSYSSANVIPAGGVDKMLPFVMLNRGNVACCLTAYGASDTEPFPTVLPNLDGKQLMLKNGQTYFLRRKYVPGFDLVARRTEQPDHNFFENPILQFTSWVRIPDDTPSAATVGAFADGYAPTPVNPLTEYIENDNIAAHRVSNPPVFLGANHGAPSVIIEMTAHGKTNGTIRGNVYSKGGGLYQCTRVIDANRILMTSLATGDDYFWAFINPALSAGTLVYASGGGSDTGNLTASSVSPAQIYPENQNFTLDFLRDGGRRLIDSGAYESELNRTHLSYGIPNQKMLQEFITENVGNSNEIYYNDSDIPTQVQINSVYLDHPIGSTTVFYQRTAVQPYFCAAMWPSQHQAMTYMAGSGETLHFFMEAVKPFQAGIMQNGGSQKDFANTASITGNVLEYYARDSVWEDANYWSDNRPHAPTLFMFEVRNSLGNPTKRYVICNDDAEGRSSVDGFTSIAMFLSGANKAYPAVQWEDTVTGGHADMTIGAWGFIDPAFDPQAIVNFTYSRGGGAYGFRWHTLETLTDYDIPMPAFLEGMTVSVVNGKRASTVALQTSVVTNGKIRVTTTGPGGFSALVQKGT